MAYCVLGDLTPVEISFRGCSKSLIQSVFHNSCLCEFLLLEGQFRIRSEQFLLEAEHFRRLSIRGNKASITYGLGGMRYFQCRIEWLHCRILVAINMILDRSTGACQETVLLLKQDLLLGQLREYLSILNRLEGRGMRLGRKFGQQLFHLGTSAWVGSGQMLQLLLLGL